MKQTKTKNTNLYIFFYILKQYCQNIQIFQDYDNFWVPTYAFFKYYREEQRPSGRADFSEPWGPGFDSTFRQPQVAAH